MAVPMSAATGAGRVGRLGHQQAAGRRQLGIERTVEVGGDDGGSAKADHPRRGEGLPGARQPLGARGRDR